MEKEPTPSGWIPELIEELTDGATKLVPVLQKNTSGTVLLILLVCASTVCSVAFMAVWKDPQPLERLHYGKNNP